jgi:hypothetical protein
MTETRKLAAILAADVVGYSRLRRLSHSISASGHFRPIDGVCAMSAIHPISTKLLHYGDRRSGPTAERRYHCPNSGHSF